MRPVVGLTPWHDTERDRFFMPPGYLQAVEACGAVPVILSQSCDPEVLARYASLVDGLLITGGCDLEPSCYGAARQPHCNVSQPERDAFELSLLNLVLEVRKPVLGICRGMQLLNVACGGTLYQDLAAERPGTAEHRLSEPLYAILHEVEVVAGSALAAVAGEAPLPVNSRHHQAVCKLGEGLEPMAFSPDGLIEAVSLSSRPFVWGVQWHPENLWDKDPRHRAIFEAFVGACRGAEGA